MGKLGVARRRTGVPPLRKWSPNRATANLEPAATVCDVHRSPPMSCLPSASERPGCFPGRSLSLVLLGVLAASPMSPSCYPEARLASGREATTGERRDQAGHRGPHWLGVIGVLSGRCDADVRCATAVAAPHPPHQGNLCGFARAWAQVCGWRAPMRLVLRSCARGGYMSVRSLPTADPRSGTAVTTRPDPIGPCG